MKHWTSFCYVLSLTEAESPYGTAIRVKLTSSYLCAGQLLVCLHELNKGWAPLLGLEGDKWPRR